MRKMVEQINNEEDFQSYVTSCGTKSKKLQRHNIEYNEYNMVCTVELYLIIDNH